MCALEGRKNKHQLLCKTSLTGFEFLSWLGVGNRQLRPEMGTGEQMPGETRSGQGNKSQHFPNTDYNSSLWPLALVPLLSLKGAQNDGWNTTMPRPEPRAGDVISVAGAATLSKLRPLPSLAAPSQHRRAQGTGSIALPGPLTITTGSQAGLSSFVWATRIPAQIHLTLNPLLQWILLNAACLMLFLKD